MTDRMHRESGLGGVVVAYMLIRCGDRWLAMRRSLGRSKWPGLWEMPGGHAGPYEQPAQAARRECREEVGLDLKPLRQVYAMDTVDMFGSGRIYMVRVFECLLTLPVSAVGVRLSQEHDALRWMRIGESPMPSSPILKEFFNAWKEVHV